MADCTANAVDNGHWNSTCKRSCDASKWCASYDNDIRTVLPHRLHAELMEPDCMVLLHLADIPQRIV
jgi:hypothetical protein